MNGYSLFSLDLSDGTLIVAPESNLSNIFDELQDKQQRAHIDFACTIWGHYEWQVGEAVVPVKGQITIRVEDDVCWKPVAWGDTLWYRPEESIFDVQSQAQCRTACRRAPNCALYFYYIGNLECAFVAPCGWGAAVGCDPYDEGQGYVIIEKIANCSQGSSCLVFSGTDPVWLYAGVYCPLSLSLNPETGQKTGYVYHKTGLTEEASFYLQPAEAVEGLQGSPCSTGSGPQSLQVVSGTEVYANLSQSNSIRSRWDVYFSYIYCHRLAGRERLRAAAS